MPVDRLHDAAVPAAALQREAVAQLAVLVFQLANLVAVALVGVVDLFLVVVQQGELAVLVGDQVGRAGEAPIAFDGLVDLGLRKVVSLPRSNSLYWWANSEEETALTGLYTSGSSADSTPQDGASLVTLSRRALASSGSMRSNLWL